MNFLKKAKDSSALLSEQRILEYLAKLDKAIVISLDTLENFQKYILDIKREIERAAKSDIHHFEIGKDGIISKTVIGQSRINELDFHNLVDEKFGSYTGYCFIVNAGISYVMHGGVINSEVGGSLVKFKTMQELLNTKKNVSDLREVFENFYSACKYKKNFYMQCFETNGMIRAEIKEQELRNILMKYLDQNVKGEVQPEFCTDYFNDEESVDIYLNDGIERAIIEVKFSFDKKYYMGSTYYDFEKRIGDGVIQLDKYAKHLAKDKRQVEYGYVYMFYCNDMAEQEIEQKIAEKLEEMQENLSSDFFSIYKRTITNNMKGWACAD